MKTKPLFTSAKERPILFKPEMVRAILDGRKSQTRRVLKDKWYQKHGLSTLQLPAENCPYGSPGDRLWVRETLVESSVGSDDTHKAGYLASLPTNPGDKYDLRFYPDAAVRKNGKLVDWWDVVKRKRNDKKPSCTLPSIFMPRWASRLTLAVTNVRVERVREITPEDGIAEGLEHWSIFPSIWDKMHGEKHPWSSNPWVWVVEFKKVAI